MHNYRILFPNAPYVIALLPFTQFGEAILIDTHTSGYYRQIYRNTIHFMTQNMHTINNFRSHYFIHMDVIFDESFEKNLQKIYREILKLFPLFSRQYVIFIEVSYVLYNRSGRPVNWRTKEKKTAQNNFHFIFSLKNYTCW